MPIEANEKLSQAKKLTQALQSDDKRKRKAALVDFRTLLEPEIGNEELRHIFTETQVYTFNCLRDKTELVREEATKFVTFLIIVKLPINDFYLTYLFPVLVERLGSVELVEESEEIRLGLVTFLQEVILKYTNTEQLKPFLGDSVLILAETIKDKHPAIKELSARCVIDLAQALPRDFHMQAEALTKPLVSCLGHQRYRVRVEAVNAIGEVVMHASYNALNDVVVPLAERLFDSIPVVRRTVAQVAARWLLDYRDRYSFFAKILPLLMTGLNDEVEETRAEAHQLWERVGKQFEKENEKDLKDQLDFLVAPPTFYPEKLKRPNLGCRTLVQRNISKLAKALAMELTSWQQDIRVRVSQLLCALVLHAEEGLTQNLQELLPAMYSAARDEDVRVADNVVRASEIIGVFIPNQTWRKLVLPAIEDGVHWGHLIVLAALIRGSPKELIHFELEDITSVIADDSVAITRKAKNHAALTKIVEAVAEKYEPAENDVAYHLFKITLLVYSLQDDQLHYNLQIFDTLYKTFKFDSKSAYWGRYLGRLLVEIGTNPTSWTIITPQRCIFDTVLTQSESAFGEYLPKIGRILQEALDPECDAESRLKTFLALTDAFDKKAVIFKGAIDLSAFFDALIRNVFVPSLVWRAGRTAEAIRTMAASCLLTALTPIEGVSLFDSSDNLRDLFDRLLPLVLALMEDASFRSRELSIEIIVNLKLHLTAAKIWAWEDLLKVYGDVLKRLDDPTEKVRIKALEQLVHLFTDSPSSFQEASLRSHHELIVDTLLTHFDDEDERIQSLVANVIKVIATINQSEVRSKIERHKGLLRNKTGLDELIQYVNQL